MVLSEGIGGRLGLPSAPILNFFSFRTLVKLVPGFLQFRILRNVEYVKAVTSSPDVNSLRDRLEKLIEEKKV